ncbi:MAG: 16S rRNA (cytidine(1402)-2'-O)-methyltransferase [Deltaproteobacteria bacterium]|nr:16S rRNA (cytidine(1402)-2'-O)-methyltransferase [Deltaproteobacteria bacterium]
MDESRYPESTPRAAEGCLYVVAVPLGNPDDITQRALRVLAEVDCVAAEDTRTAARLLARHGLRKPLVSYHDWNEEARARQLLARLERGEQIALVSEAGTPGISDPGFDLVRLARQSGHRVVPVPGPSAVAAFLSASGLPTHAFSFHGFPPKRAARRRAFFRELRDRTETLVFYESPHRILAALDDALAEFGDREAALAREMTKPHEEFLWGTISRIRGDLERRDRVRGEVCWGVRGRDPRRPRKADEADTAEAAARVEALGLAPRRAARELARLTGMSTDEAYRYLSERRKRR